MKTTTKAVVSILTCLLMGCAQSSSETVSAPPEEQVEMKPINAMGIRMLIPAEWKSGMGDDGYYIVPDASDTSVASRITLFTLTEKDVENMELIYEFFEESVQKKNPEFTQESFLEGKAYYFTDDQGIEWEYTTFPIKQNSIMVVSFAMNMSMKPYFEKADFTSAEVPVTTPEPTPEPTPVPTPEPTPEPTLTAEKFNQIEQNMTLAQVQELLGEEGSCEYSFDIMGQSSETWQFGSNILRSITCSFTNGRLTGKSQAGILAEAPAPTKEQYDQLTEGMTYSQVAEIIGEGELSSVDWTFGIRSETYHWGKGLGLAMLVFQDGRLESKSQFGLE